MIKVGVQANLRAWYLYLCVYSVTLKGLLNKYQDM